MRVPMNYITSSRSKSYRAKRFLRIIRDQYLIAVCFLIIGTVNGSVISYHAVKPVVVSVSQTCIDALEDAYAERRD